jgi:hypothetical protein
VYNDNSGNEGLLMRFQWQAAGRITIPIQFYKMMTHYKMLHLLYNLINEE